MKEDPGETVDMAAHIYVAFFFFLALRNHFLYQGEPVTQIATGFQPDSKLNVEYQNKIHLH